MSLLQRQALKQRLGGGLPPMPPPGVGGGKKKALNRKRDYSPVYWDKYFERMHDVEVRENTFRVYECGTEGPVLMFLHGGGFSALSWAVLSSAISHLVTCRCAAVDLRGHGDSVSTDDNTLSADVMSSDVGDIVRELYGESPPPIVLIGHSMGGAIAVHTASRDLISSLSGLVVIDVVEGTALEALSSMQNFLRGRPKVFRSLEHAIEWCVRSGQVRNIDSARVSMVGQVKRADTNETGSSVMEHEHEHEHDQPPCHDTIAEEEEEEGSDVTDSSSTNQQQGQSSPSANQQQKQTSPANQNQDISSSEFKQPDVPEAKYTWRIDLGKTEPYWRGWFEGLSNKFLSCSVPKMLLLAGGVKTIPVRQKDGQLLYIAENDSGFSEDGIISEETLDRQLDELDNLIREAKAEIAEKEHKLLDKRTATARLRELTYRRLHQLHKITEKGVDRLDKDLTIGQMQGKFQMQVLPKSGHAVHEDVPEQVAEALATFLTRNKMATATANFEPVFPGC